MSQEPKTTGIARALIALALVVGIGGWFFPNSMFLSNMIGSSAACADDTAAADGSNGSDGTNGTDGANGTDGTDGTNGTDGTDGKNGSTGATGACGPTGSTGPAGSDGLSAYEVWAKTNDGTVDDYLNSLVGADGAQGIQGIQGIQGPKGDPGNIGPAGADGRDGVNGLGDYASFYDTTTQTNPVVNGTNTMTYNNTALSHGVSVVDGSKITFTHAGVYNIAFSAQLDKTDSGQDQVAIWLAKNGNNESWSATMVDANNNNAKVVAAWNFFVEVQAGDYYQLKWKSADSDLRLFAQPTNAIPGVPSIILTVNQVG